MISSDRRGRVECKPNTEECRASGARLAPVEARIRHHERRVSFGDLDRLVQ
jgi:hypothetical protein